MINAGERFLLRMAPGTTTIDAILVNQNDGTDESCGLQMTVSTQHKLNHAGAINLVNYLNTVAFRARYKIFFVLPSDIYDTFQRQNQKFVSAKDSDIKLLSKQAARLDQFILCID